MAEGVGYYIPVSNGIFAHRRRIGSAIWTFLWLIDHTTKERPGEDGQIDGLVLGGAPVRARRIAADLDESIRTVQAHLDQLAREGYITRIPAQAGDASGYLIRKSKKWVRSRTISLAGKGDHETPKYCEPPQEPADPSQEPAEPHKNLRTNNERQLRDTHPSRTPALS